MCVISPSSSPQSPDTDIIILGADTEIDWKAYMQEVEGYQRGERDYVRLQGDTGPLVYPAGFVYLFSWLKTITGGDIKTAQAVYALLYLATQAVAMALYINTKTMPPWSLGLLCISRRVHSIFLLRLFNDCWAVFLALVATLTLQMQLWSVAILLYSAAVSIKMSVLIMAPGVLAVMIKASRPREVFLGIAAGVALQAALGAPFLMAAPASYLSRAFELTRVFQYEWTVNWKFIPEKLFISGRFALVLLTMHLRLLWSFAKHNWGVCGGDTLSLFWSRMKRRNGSLITADEVVCFVCTANLIGIVCARSLHFQFYSWYWHSLPYLVLRSQTPLLLSLLVLVGIEVVWNVFPPTAMTSLVLLTLHISLLVALWQSRVPKKDVTECTEVHPRRKKAIVNKVGRKAWLMK